MITYRYISLSSIAILLANFIAVYSKYLASEFIMPTSNLLMVGIIYILAVSTFLSVFGVIVMVSEGKKDMLFFYGILIGTLTVNLLINYQMTSSLEVLINGLMILSSLLLVEIRYKKEISNQIKYNLSSITNTTGTFIFFLAISISLNYYLLNSSESSGKNMFDKTKSYLINTSNIYIEKTVGTEFLQKNLPNLNMEIYNKAEASKEIEQQTTEVKSQIKDQMSTKINELLNPYEPYFVPLSTALIFISALSLIPIIRIATLIISYIVFKILKVAHLVEERVENIEVVRYRV